VLLEGLATREQLAAAGPVTSELYRPCFLLFSIRLVRSLGGWLKGVFVGLSERLGIDMALHNESECWLLKFRMKSLIDVWEQTLREVWPLDLL
jgi:hypothetical protein